MMNKNDLDLPLDKIAEYCKRWQIIKLELFGSYARGEATDESDYDFLATFTPNNNFTLLDDAQMELELEELLGRRVDLHSYAALKYSRNQAKKKRILESTITIYEEK